MGRAEITVSIIRLHNEYKHGLELRIPQGGLAENRMEKLGHGRLIAGLAALALIIGASWIALERFVPSLPLKVTIATGRKGTTFEYFGERYRTRFARAGVELNVRETNGALENLKLLRDPHSGVQIAFSAGGISNGAQAPDYSNLIRRPSL